jgi:N,N'-diacetyllegionaminate synthase
MWLTLKRDTNGQQNGYFGDLKNLRGFLMYKNKQVLAILPARGGSKRIPHKNRKRLCGKPLITYTLDQAKKSMYIDTVVVSSDDTEILEVCRPYNCIRQKRPLHLAEDTTPTLDVIRHVLRQTEQEQNVIADIIILLQPTSPLRTSSIIDECIEKVVDENLDSVHTVTQVQEHPSIMFKQERNKHTFNNKEAFFDKQKRKKYSILNGAVWAITRNTVMITGLYGEKNGHVMMDRHSSIDIDTFEDWLIAEKRIQTPRSEIKIANKTIGDNHPVFIIAEAGVNHNGDLSLAKKLIDVAYDSGADAVKFQTFNPLTGTNSTAEKTEYQKENDGAQGNYQTMLQQLQLSEGQFKQLAQYAKEKGILFMSTASDHESLEIVKRLDVPAFKIGSGHITNIPLLQETAKCGKPMIMSVGMATYTEIDEAIAAIINEGNNDIILLHCVSQYPTPIDDANLNMVTELKKEYSSILIGYSDHTIGNEASIASIALGACMIERHITLDKTMNGPDHKASLELHELKDLVIKAKEMKRLLGTGEKKRTPGEEEVAKKARRSIFAHQNIPSGTIIKNDMIRMKKPETGLKPKYYTEVIGRKTIRDIAADTPLQWEDIV